MEVKDITGMRFGSLKVLRREKQRKSGTSYWLCRCDCGNIVTVSKNKLTSKIHPAESCGCIQTSPQDEGRYIVCIHCRSDKHYAKGYCKSCYYKFVNGKLD